MGYEIVGDKIVIFDTSRRSLLLLIALWVVGAISLPLIDMLFFGEPWRDPLALSGLGFVGLSAMLAVFLGFTAYRRVEIDRSTGDMVTERVLLGTRRVDRGALSDLVAVNLGRLPLGIGALPSLVMKNDDWSLSPFVVWGPAPSQLGEAVAAFLNVPLVERFWDAE